MHETGISPLHQYCVSWLHITGTFDCTRQIVIACQASSSDAVPEWSKKLAK
jgi:hypothetical protein